MSRVLSIQSLVAAGHVGHGASAYALALEGIEAVVVPTVVLSGHAATPGVQGRRLPAEEIAALGRGFAAAGVYAGCDAILTGYPGGAEAAEAVADLVAQAKAARPDALYLCDPVLGDDGPGLYLPAEVGEVYRARLLPLADVAMPNRFELGWLTGLPVGTVAEIRAAAQALRAAGPEVVIVTSVPVADGVGLLTASGGGAWLTQTPRVERSLSGAGDFVAAAALAALVKGATPQAAAARAAGAAWALAQAAERLGRDDLPVVLAQDAWRGARPAESRALD
ncbi:pyridoxal kinase [Albimonas sp. CAU 1670]|uniref:pyridoxal kinase n=1 Tax=Albimonas sp. CAU 1670 TaxID=3032599 RepID=UPI0023DC7E3C|nr:pyridoxal kinase [Albimonas sp. CAU 1670]MDF2231683.1 pyridoxal kinase [Albimonas sp. CAU 1670]